MELRDSMMIQCFVILLLCGSLRTFSELRPGACELTVKNENKAEITFKLTNTIEEATSIRIMRKFEHYTKTIAEKSVFHLSDTLIGTFYPDKKEISFPLNSGRYVLEACEEGKVRVKLDKKDIEVGENMYVKDGKAFYEGCIRITLESIIISIKGKIAGDNTIIKTARELWIKTPKRRYKLKVIDGEVEGEVDEEGTYDVDVLCAELPNIGEEVVGTQVEFTPKSFLVKRGGKNYFTVKVVGSKTGVKISSNVEGTYLIEKPYSRVYDLNKLVHNLSPSMTPMPYLHPEEVRHGEYLLECIRGGKVYRRRIWIPPVLNIDIYRFNEWFEESDEVSYSIAKTGGKGVAEEIIQKTYDMHLAGAPQYEDNVPVFIGERSYNFRFKAKREGNNLCSDFSIGSRRFAVLELKRIEGSKIEGDINTVANLYAKVRSQFDGRYTEGVEGAVILERSYYVEPFKVEFRADIKFHREGLNWTGLEVVGNTIVYKVYQVGSGEGNLLDFFK